MYSDSIPIPSKGIFYEGEPEYLQVYYMTTEDELSLTTPNIFAKGDALVNLLKKTVCEPNNIKYEDLLLHDRDYLLLFLKDNAYGYVLDYAGVKGLDKSKEKDSVYFDSQNIEIKMGLDKIPDDGLFYTYRWQNYIFKIRLLKTTDIPKINKRSRLSYYIQHIYSINENTDRKYIQSFMESIPIIESKKIKKFIDSLAFGLNKKTWAIIGGNRVNIDLVIDESLFGLNQQNIGKIAKSINDSIFFLLNEGNGYTEQGLLKMPVHIRKLHEEKLIQKINKINENMKNSK